MKADIAFAPFDPSHLDRLELRPEQAVRRELVSPELAAALAVPDLAWSGFHDGRLVGCAGIMPQTAWSGEAWALVGRCVPLRLWPAITRHAIATLAVARRRGLHRIVAHVDPDFPAACRWIRRLGFEAEGIASRWFPDRRDAITCARTS